MNKILKVNLKDIIYDYQQASEIVNKACNRQIPMEVKGGFLSDNNIVLFLEQVMDNEKDCYSKYIFSPFEGMAEADIIAEVSSRYYAGFTTIFCFETENKTWGLFAKRVIIS